MKKIYTQVLTALLFLVSFSGYVSAQAVGGAVVVKATALNIDSVCATSNSTQLELQGEAGTILRWEFSNSGGNPWITIAHTDDELTVTNLSTNTYFRVVLMNPNDSTDTDISDSVYLRVDQPSVAGTLVGDNTVCSGSNSGTVSLSGNNAGVRAWMFSQNNGSSWTVDAGARNTTETYTNLTQTNWYRVIVKNGACADDTTNTIKVNVKAQTVAGAVTTGGSSAVSVCSGNNSGTMTLAGHTGDVIAWERADATSGPWTQIFNNKTTHTYTNLTSTTYYRAIVANGPCDTLSSGAVVITVDPTSQAGTVGGDLVKCTGANSGTLSTTGFTGTGTNWLSSTDSSSWTLEANPSTSFNYSNLTDTTWYRAIVTSGTCPADTSDPVRVDVNPVTVGGSINSVTVCNQVNNGTLTLSGNTGIVQRWESAQNPGGPWASIVNTASTLNYQNLIQTTYYRAVIESPGCAQANSSISTVTVDPTSVAGSITGAGSVCVSGNSTVLNVTGSTGNAVDWLFSTNSGGAWSLKSNAADTLAISNQNSETWYRYINKSGVCANDTSAIYKLKVDPASVGGSMAGTATVCSGANSGTISLSGNTGTVIRWETAVNANGPWSGVTYTASSLNYTNLTNSVYYRAVVKSGECSETASDSAYIKVEPALAGGRIAGTGTGCEGENSGVLVLNNFGGTITKWQYSDNGGTSWTDSVTSASSLAYSNLLKTTLFRVEVQAGVCGSTLSDTATITIFSEPKISFTAPRTCQDKAVNFGNNTINGNNNQYSWAFGDGNASNLFEPKYTYSSHGSFLVRLTALSSDNCQASDTMTIIIDSIPSVTYASPNVCNGDTTSFTNNSTPVGGTSTWSFGDGGSSNSTSPKHKFGSEGSYSTSLLYRAPNGCEVTKTQITEVYPQPVSTYQNPSVAETKSFQFTNNSYVTSGNIGFQWIFGDGNTSIVQNPTHTYSDTGDYSVQLISFNQNCRDTLSKTVVANPIPSASFTVSNLCQKDSVVFTNTSSIKKGGMTYHWDFDDGNSSTMVSPKHQYAAPGNYKVTLTLTSDSGFVGSVIQNVTIDPLPIPNFTIVQACEGDTSEFKNISTINGGSSSFIWDFGVSGAGANTTDAKYRYNTGGSYNVKLTATSNKGCVDSIIKTNVVFYRPVVRWGTDTVCEGTATRFTDSTTVQGSRASTFNWDFGNNNGSGVQNPTYTYSNFGTYLGKLKVTSAQGCVDSLIKNVVVNALPLPNYSANNGCQRDSLQFNNTSSHPQSSAITYSWDFGFTGGSSTVASPRMAFANAGNFNVKLVVRTTATGCADSVTKVIVSHPRSVPAFSATGACHGNSNSFSNASSVSSGTLTYFWEFGDLNTSTSPSPTHTYTNAGSFTTKLSVTTSQGCLDSISKAVFVWPQPLAKFTTQNVCFGDSLVVNNTSTYTTGAPIPDSTISYVWDFGDGDTSHQKSIKHLYTNSGNYKVTLSSTTDSGCVSSTFQNVEVYALPVVDFEFVNKCEYDSLPFTNKSSSVYGTIKSNWYFGDNFSDTLVDPKHKYAKWGNYTVKLEVTDKFACLDSAVKVVRVHPVPTAIYETTPVCDGERMEFKDVSTVPADTVIEWAWFFGDGTGSALKEPVHLYLNDGSYPTRLIAKTDNGCIDDTSMASIVHPLPIANYTVARACLNDPIPLSDKAYIKSGFVTYLYEYGDGAKYEVPEPAHIPAKAGDISIKQTVTSEFGCMDSLIRGTEVWKLPVIMAEKDTSLSYGLSFRLGVSGANTYLWEPTRGLDDPTSDQPVFDALNSTDFVVTGTDENGCANTDTIAVLVDQDFQVFPSEVITPDGNGYNDQWIVKNAENYPNCNVQILDRWGNEVFSETGYKNTWEGTNKNNDILPDGTYYYIVTFEGSSRSYKGALTIIRNK